MGCAASPYAWKDLGDGQGMHGWAGIPLRQSIPIGLAAGMQEMGRSMQQNCQTPIPQMYTAMPIPGGGAIMIGQ
jgi:hypothetical protein